MVPRSLLPALAAVTVLTAGLLPGAAAAPAGPARTVPARAPAAEVEEVSPLRLTLDSMSPSVLGRPGPIRFRGTVTNTTDEPWLDINVYPFSSWNDLEPTVATTSAELSDQMLRGETEDVGNRYTTLDNFRPIDRLEPGETADYVSTITAEQTRQAGTEGVYWVGVHAMGQPESLARDGFTDGRARTFIPLVRRGATAVETALALPLRHPVRHRGNGAVARTAVWTRLLSAGGRLDRMLGFADAADGPVTWLVDPAVPAAAQALAAGNAGRSLAPTQPSEGEQPGEESPSASPTGTVPDGEAEVPTDPGQGESDQRSAADQAAVNAAAAWLEQAAGTLAGSEVLLLPYGDVDVTASVDHDPEWYRQAREHTGATLGPWDLPGEAAVAPPSGRLPGRALPVLDEATTVLVDDTVLGPEALPDGEDAPTVVEVAGRRMLVGDSTAAAGGPGPDDPLGGVSLRQQVLAEAALRAIDGGGSMAVVLPRHWQPPETLTEAAGFFDGLALPWLRLVPMGELALEPAVEVAAEDLSEASRDSSRLTRATLATAQRLLSAGRRLDRVLYRNDRVAGQVAGEAFTTTSYDDGARPRAARQEAQRSIRWISRQLARVRIEAPPSVVLGGDVGLVRTVLVNDTEYAVEVRVQAEGGDEVQLESSRTMRLQPGARTQVDLQASTRVLGEHDVDLVVTDAQGERLGATATVPVRATEVSQVIWLVIALGVALLVSAIVARLYRRLRDAGRRRREARAARRAAAGGTADPGRDDTGGTDHPAGTGAGSAR